MVPGGQQSGHGTSQQQTSLGGGARLPLVSSSTEGVFGWRNRPLEVQAQLPGDSAVLTGLVGQQSCGQGWARGGQGDEVTKEPVGAHMF